jgi:hypothetical protein
MPFMMSHRLSPEALQGIKKMPIIGELSLEHAMLIRILLATDNTIKAIDLDKKTRHRSHHHGLFAI